MTQEVKKYFTDKQGADRPKRKQWFLEQFTTVPEVIYGLSGEDINASWLAAFSTSKNPREELGRMQKRITRLASVRKAVVEQYIQLGEFLLDGIDFYRYNLVKNEKIADTLPDQWDGKK